MASYFSTNPEAVEVAMGVTGIKHHRLVHALIERGFNAEEIKAMSPEARLDEYMSWEGLNGWTRTLLDIAKAAGFVVGERKERGAATDEEMRSYLEGVVGAVDADSYAQHALWADYAEDAIRFRPGCDRRRYPWKSTGHGLLTCVGTIGDMEVWVSLMTVTVNDHKLLFYYASGTYVDHNMVRSWLEKNLPDTAKGARFPGGFNHTDATNFCNIFFRMEHA